MSKLQETIDAIAKKTKKAFADVVEHTDKLNNIQDELNSIFIFFFWLIKTKINQNKRKTKKKSKNTK